MLLLMFIILVRIISYFSLFVSVPGEDGLLPGFAHLYGNGSGGTYTFYSDFMLIVFIYDDLCIVPVFLIL